MFYRDRPLTELAARVLYGAAPAKPLPADLLQSQPERGNAPKRGAFAGIGQALTKLPAGASIQVNRLSHYDIRGLRGLMLYYGVYIRTRQIYHLGSIWTQIERVA